ncbi:MAG: peptidase S9, partial [Bacteroidetes bacterium]
NHGQAFVESIKGHYYEYEVPDIINGIDSLIAKGVINRDSLAVMGWSNGAILTTSLIIQYPGMFKAAAPGAGDVNWTSDFGTCEFGVTFDQSYFKGAPWDDTKKKPYNEAYILKSPLFDMEKIVTPTILSHGSEDRAVPRDQSHEFYRALQQIGKAPVRFLWYPDQPHSLRKLTYQTRKVEEEMRWWDTYFFGTYKPVNEAVKKESPLMALLEKEKSATHNGHLGYLQNKVLLPEVVTIKADSIAIGRFEVTNAQWQQFRTNHSYPVSQANHPVSGISFEEARAYAAWLSEQSGERYRLPNAAEAEALQEKALDIATDENTLPYWAGYEITRDDAVRLKAKLSEVKTTLTLEAGTFKPTSLGKALVYDLGGNVAEYFDQGEKAGQYGYSAWDLPDAAEKQPFREPKGAGLRVVKELK